MYIDLWMGKLSCPGLEMLHFLFASFSSTSLTTLTRAEQSSFARGKGEQPLLQ